MYDDAENDQFAEVDTDSEVDSEVDSDGECDAFAGVDEDCLDSVNGIKIVMDTPKCQEQARSCGCAPKCEGFEDAMLGAMGELSTNANKLADALKKQFAKNKELAAAKSMKVSGNLDFTPVVANTKVIKDNATTA